ncbi:MAG: hypothetical protein FGM33_08375 [Candidatus Kapabacteria bacterium]|nr:hypothetical protein [Candidatus Kapabacteria bacterium]
MVFFTRLLIVMVAVSSISLGQEFIERLSRTQSRTDLAGLFRAVERPQSFKASHEASFVELDMDIFARARQMPDDMPFVLRLTLPGIGPVEAVVARYRVIDESTVLTAMTADGPVRIPAPQSVLVRGYIPSVKGSYVVAAIYPEWSTAMITTGKETAERTFIMSSLPAAVAPSTMIIYDQAAVPATNDWACHADDNARLPKRPRMDKSADQKQVRYRQIKIAIECDEPYYIDHGRNLTKSTQYAESVVAASSAIYERDITATHIITQLVVWTTVDPYPGTNSSQLLTQFTNRWSASFPNVDRALAHLLSGINGIGGIAYLDVLCDKGFGYAVSGLNNNITYPATGYVWDTDVFSHETGHNVGSPHTFNCWWNPPIDSCVSAEGGTCYTGTKAVKGTIMSYCHLTASGTNLNFHPRVQSLMKGQLLDNLCTPLTYELKVTIADTIRACQSGTKSVTATASDGAEPYTYRWYSAFFDTTTTSNSYTIRQPGNYKFFVEVRDNTGTKVTDTCVLRTWVTPKPKLTASTTKICSGKSVDLTCEVTGGAAPYNYQWLRNGVLIPTVGEFHTQRIDVPTRFTVIVSDSNGCFDSASIQIGVYDLQMTFTPTNVAIPALPSCQTDFNQEYTLTNTGADTLVIDSIAHGNAIRVTAPLPVTIPPGVSIKIPTKITVRGTGMLREDIAFIEKRCGWRFRGAVSGLRSVAKIFSPMPFDMGTKLACDSVTERYVVVGFNNPTSLPMSFSNVYSQSTKNTVRMDRETFVVPAGGDRSMLIILTSTLTQGTLTDTLLLPYESGTCEGLFKVPVTLRVSSASVSQPNRVTFDTIRTNSRPIIKQVPITATLTGAQQVTVQSVEITEPFTTSMKNGLVLQHNRQTQVTVTLDPKNITTGGTIKGELKYQLDSCAVSYTVPISADVVVVSVDDEQADLRGAATVVVRDGAIVVAPTAGRIGVYDLRGQLVASTTGVGQEQTFTGLAVGCYLVTIQDDRGGVFQTTIACVVR